MELNEQSAHCVADLLQVALGQVQLAHLSAYNRAYGDVFDRMARAEQALLALRGLLREGESVVRCPGSSVGGEGDGEP